MPLVELLDRSAWIDGWHDVRSPGGYEWWYFDAEDAASDTQIVAIFMQGFIFHPGYLRRYARYHKRPTVTPPPVGADYPCVYFCVYRAGKVWKQFFTQYAPGTLVAARDRCDVAFDPGNSAFERAAGVYALSVSGKPWRLTARGPLRDAANDLTATLIFTRAPAEGPPVRERTFLSAAMTGAEHRWAVIAPRCDVGGRIQCDGETIDFAGTGYHDHNYGTAPIGRGLSRWTWGRAFFGDERVMTFHHAEPKDRSRSAETHLIEASSRGEREIASERVVGDWSLVCNAAMRLRYPRSLDFGPALRLSNPRVIDPSPFYLRLQFEAESFGERSKAFCEIAYPHRLRWPILGRMIEMSFDRRASTPPSN